MPISKAAADGSTGGVPSGAHGATNKEHHVCARRRVGEAAGSPLRMLSRPERRMGKSASRRAGVGRVRNADFFSILQASVFVSVQQLGYTGPASTVGRPIARRMTS